jgi:hypothetical protein
MKKKLAFTFILAATVNSIQASPNPNQARSIYSYYDKFSIDRSIRGLGLCSETFFNVESPQELFRMQLKRMNQEQYTLDATEVYA